MELGDLLIGIEVYRRALIESPSPILVVREIDGSIFDASESFCRILRGTRKAIQDRLFIDLVHPDDKDFSLKAFRDLRRSGAQMINAFENRYRRSDGSYARIEWTPANASTAGCRIAYCREVQP